jgi:hypothetical protein
VLIAGGLMALGWVLFILSILTGQVGAALTFLFLVMFPINFYWRWKLRRERKAADPEGYAAERKARRKAGRRRQFAILGWGARTGAAQAKHSWKADSKVRVRTDFGDEYVDYEQVIGKPRMGAPPGLGGAMAESGRWWVSIISAFFTPMRAAVAEWRARP